MLRCVSRCLLCEELLAASKPACNAGLGSESADNCGASHKANSKEIPFFLSDLARRIQKRATKAQYEHGEAKNTSATSIVTVS